MKSKIQVLKKVLMTGAVVFCLLSGLLAENLQAQDVSPLPSASPAATTTVNTFSLEDTLLLLAIAALVGFISIVGFVVVIIPKNWFEQIPWWNVTTGFIFYMGMGTFFYYLSAPVSLWFLFLILVIISVFLVDQTSSTLYLSVWSFFCGVFFILSWRHFAIEYAKNKQLFNSEIIVSLASVIFANAILTVILGSMAGEWTLIFTNMQSNFSNTQARVAMFTVAVLGLSLGLAIGVSSSIFLKLTPQQLF